MLHSWSTLAFSAIALRGATGAAPGLPPTSEKGYMPGACPGAGAVAVCDCNPVPGSGERRNQATPKPNAKLTPIVTNCAGSLDFSTDTSPRKKCKHRRDEVTRPALPALNSRPGRPGGSWCRSPDQSGRANSRNWHSGHRHCWCASHTRSSCQCRQFRLSSF